MDDWMIYAGAGAAALALLAIAWMIGRRVARNRAAERRLIDDNRDRFGAEFDRLAEQIGTEQAADQLRETAAQIGSVDVQRVAPSEREEFTDRWNDLQHTFLDSPTAALRGADVLVTDVMSSRNLPTGEFEARVVAVAEHEGDLAVAYRDAHDLFVAIETDEVDGLTSSDFRQAMLTYQSVFELMLERPKGEQDARVDRSPTDAPLRPDTEG